METEEEDRSGLEGRELAPGAVKVGAPSHRLVTTPLTLVPTGLTLVSPSYL